MAESKLLKITGILMIIGGALALIVSVIGILGLALVTAAGVIDTGIYTISLVVAIVAGPIELVAGILGVSNSRKPEKAGVNIGFGAVVIALSIVSNILSIMAGNAFNPLSLALGLFLPALYLIGAFQLKGMAR